MLPDKRTQLNQYGHEESIQFQSRLSVDKVDALARVAAFGLGLTTLPDYMVNDLIRRQEQIEVLPQWQVNPIPHYAVWPGNISENSNTKQRVRFLSEAS